MPALKLKPRSDNRAGLSPDDIDVLLLVCLWAVCNPQSLGCRASDIGGYNGSRHSAILSKLRRYGLLTGVKVSGGHWRGVWYYMPTDEARRLINDGEIS